MVNLKNIYYLDTETYRKTDIGYVPILDSNEVILTCLMDHEGNHTFTKTGPELWELIEKVIDNSKTELTFIAHNHEYDFYGYAKHKIKELISTEKLKVIRWSPLLAFYYHNGKKHRFIDSMGYFIKTSLEDLGQEIGFKKLKMPDIIQNPNELKQYIIQDCEIIRQAIIKLDKIITNIGFKPKQLLTGPTTSMNNFITYVTRQKNAGWLLKKGKIHKNPETIEFLIQASKGGNTQVFHPYSEKTIKIDINSCYWKEMVEMPFPDLLKERILNAEEIKELGFNAIRQKEGIIEVTIQTTETNYGYLAFRSPGIGLDYNLVFPHRGEILRGTWSLTEIDYAVKKGYKIIEIHKALIYEQNLKFNYLKDYIELLWKERKKNIGDKFTNRIIKLLGNGLYGKFIQRKSEKEYKFIERYLWDEKYLEEGWKIVSADHEYCMMREKEPYIPPYQAIYLGLRISAGARIRIIEEMEKIPFKDLMYCDTDAIIFSGNHLDKFEIGNELGQFKVEAEGPYKALSGKVYYVGNDIKIAGLPKRFRTRDVIDNEMTLMVPQITGFKTGIHTNKFNKIGTFEDKIKEYKPNYKHNKKLPMYIKEVYK